LFFVPLEQKKTRSLLNRLNIGMTSYCQSTYYGNQCSIRCIPNDDCSSSYTCNSTTGSKICSMGWSRDDCNIRNTSYISLNCSTTGSIWNKPNRILNVRFFVLNLALTCNNGGFCQTFNNTNQPTCCCPTGLFIWIFDSCLFLSIGELIRIYWFELRIFINVYGECHLSE